MKSLMLHCGGQLKTREEVFQVTVPPGTETYVPLPYESLVTRIEKQLAVEGIRIKEERLALAKEGRRMFGLMQLEMQGFTQQEYGCVLGFRNSYDKSFSAGVCVGATVFVCDNLSFRGDVQFERKHTGNMLRDLSWFITETIASLPAKFAAQAATFEAYKERELGDSQVHDLAIRLWDEHALSITEIPYLLKEWRTPRHPEFAKAEKTAWRFFNAATEIIKGDLWRLPVRTQRIHAVLDDALERSSQTEEPLVLPRHAMAAEMRN